MKRALVTGCSRGIGLDVARMLLAEGWTVYGVSRNRSPIDHARFRWRTIDVGLPHHVSWSLGRTIFADSLDAVVHCAADGGPVGPLEDNNFIQWTNAITTNLIGTAAIVKAVLPLLRRSEDARILLFSGGGAFNPRPQCSAYAASKAGVVSLMETLSEELKGTTVTVNAVAPGYVPTTMHADPIHDDGEAMRLAVGCVRHLLSPATYGLTGKTISARFDDWQHIDPLTVAKVNASAMGTRRREPVALVGKLRAAV